MCVYVSMCVIRGWSEWRSNYCSFFVLRNHDPPPPISPQTPPSLPASVNPPWLVLLPSLTPQTKPRACFWCTLPGLNPIVCDNVPPDQPVGHRTPRKRAAAAGRVNRRLVWPFNLTRHTKHVKKKKLNTSNDVRCYSWIVKATTTLAATSFKQKILNVSSYYTRH